MPRFAEPELIERFQAALARLWPEEDRTGPLGLAVSGGPDSLALLLLCQDAIPDAFAVASVNHGLRPDADKDVALVEKVCRELEVPFAALSVTVRGGNVQAKAREARYAAMAQWAREHELGALATAHHADDQAETLLMRLSRGSGVSGLAGVRAAGFVPGTDLPLVRPLLDWRKSELEDLVGQHISDPARDPSNTNMTFDRVRVREHLRTHDWLDANALATSAEHLAEAWRAIEWYAEIDWEEMVEREKDSSTIRYAANVPRIIQIETVRRIVRELGGVVSRSEAGRAADRLWRGENASLGGVLAVPTVEPIARVGVEMRVWTFAPEPARRTH
ncbi:MAG: tRNA lysidine(34) synthetase TilS [Pseudomonadota bacterium]